MMAEEWNSSRCTGAESCDGQELVLKAASTRVLSVAQRKVESEENERGNHYPELKIIHQLFNREVTKSVIH